MASNLSGGTFDTDLKLLGAFYDEKIHRIERPFGKIADGNDTLFLDRGGIPKERRLTVAEELE